MAVALQGGPALQPRYQVSGLNHPLLPRSLPLGQVSMLLLSLSFLSCKIGIKLARLRPLLLGIH